MVIYDHAITPREVAHLRFPGAQVATVLADPDQRRAIASLLVVDIYFLNARRRQGTELLLSCYLTLFLLSELSCAIDSQANGSSSPIVEKRNPEQDHEKPTRGTPGPRPPQLPA